MMKKKIIIEYEISKIIAHLGELNKDELEEVKRRIEKMIKIIEEIEKKQEMKYGIIRNKPRTVGKIYRDTL